jgi:hypothetical protein
MLARLTPRFGTMDLGLNAGHDPFGDLFLDDKDIGDLAVVTLREQVVAGRRFDEQHRDADLLAGAPCAALDQIGCAQLSTNLRDVLGPALVGKCRIARDHRKPAPICKRCNDILGKSVDEIVFHGVTLLAKLDPGYLRRRLGR